MKSKKYTDDFKTQLIKEALETGNATLVSDRHKIPQKTLNNWMIKYQNNKNITVNKNLKLIEKENKDLKLENQILKDLLKKTVLVWNNE